MNTKYYFWQRMYKQTEWQPQGNLYGYDSLSECIKENKHSVELAFEWTVLEAKPYPVNLQELYKGLISSSTGVKKS